MKNQFRKRDCLCGNGKLDLFLATERVQFFLRMLSASRRLRAFKSTVRPVLRFWNGVTEPGFRWTGFFLRRSEAAYARCVSGKK